MKLETIGWSSFHSEQFAPFSHEGLVPGRVALEHRGAYTVWTADGETDAVLAGRVRRAAAERGDLPTVGDWVALRRASGARTTVRAVLERLGAFYRKVPGARVERQVVAANVDAVFVVTGLDGDYNLRRIERYLTIVYDGGASPVVVLNKADVCDDLDARVAAVEAVAAGVPVVALSARSGAVEPLEAFLRPARTVALIGSSGAGKSTIANALLGRDVLRTGAVRVGDDRGRHTTTRRELFLLPGGALLVDTPGLREIQAWASGDEDGLDSAFTDVASLARGCRFGDCRHAGEPGCAVAEALEDGTLDAGRLSSYRTLERELAHAATKQDERLRLAQKQRWKAIHKAMRGAGKRS